MGKFSIGAGTTAEFMPKRLIVADQRGSNRKSSAADGGMFEMRYVQAIGAGRAEYSSTRYVSNTSEWSLVSRCGIVKNFAVQYCNPIGLLYARRDPQPS